VDNQVVKDDYSFKPMIDTSVFDAPDPNRVRFSKPKKRPLSKPTVPPKARMKAVSKNANALRLDLTEIKNGTRVSHSRFGFGTVLQVEGSGGDAKALILFDQSGEKNLLLRFAKLKIVA
jgi:DNA helicase-2/ATP-dependent DNA helicase PcrA